MAFGCAMMLKARTAVAVAACALAFAGCAANSSMPSLGLPNLDLFDFAFDRHRHHPFEPDGCGGARLER